MKKTTLSIVIAAAFYTQIFAQNVGIGTNNPASKTTVNGNLSVGASYTGTAAPVNGAIIQGTLGLGTSNPSNSAALDISSTTKGILIPRLTTVERTDITSPATGLMVYDTNDGAFYYYNGTTWVKIGFGVGPTGPTGPQGPQGIQGVAGTNGAAGAQGPTGPAGTNGATGAQGVAGPTGPAGTNGTNGAAGAQGIAGPTGPQGLQGIQGVAGTNGAAGAQGIQGVAGAQGPAGPTGLLSAGTTTGNTTYWNGSSWVLNSSNIFNAGGNVGIGTSSAPAAVKFHVNGDAMVGTGTNAYFSTPAGTGALTLNGTTVGGLTRMVMNDGSVTFNQYQNAYYDGSNWKYNASAEATKFTSSGGALSLSVADAGTAGGNITWKTPLTVQKTGVVDINTSGTATTNISTGGGNVNIGSSATQVTVAPLSGTGLRPVYSDANGVLINTDAPTTTTVSPATTINNNSCASPAVSTITLADYPTSIDASIMSVTLNITHPSIADLRVYLISP